MACRLSTTSSTHARFDRSSDNGMSTTRGFHASATRGLLGDGERPLCHDLFTLLSQTQGPLLSSVKLDRWDRTKSGNERIESSPYSNAGGSSRGGKSKSVDRAWPVKRRGREGL